MKRVGRFYLSLEGCQVYFVLYIISDRNCLSVAKVPTRDSLSSPMMLSSIMYAMA